MPEPQAPILRGKLRTFRQPRLRWDLWSLIYKLHYNMAFSGHPDLAREMLEIFIASLPQGQIYNPHCNHPLLSIWTHLPSSKPTNLPSNWPSDPFHIPPASEHPDRDIFNPAFHTFFSMCGCTPRNPPATSDLIDLEALDPRSWPESTNPRHVAACARALCRVPPGGVPTREVMEEAFDAMDRVWELLLSQERDPASGLPPLAFDEVFPASVYLSFAIGLGRRDKATLLFQRLANGWSIGADPDGAKYFHNWAELYELCLREGGWLNLIARDDAEACLKLARHGLAEPAVPPARPSSPPPMFTPTEGWPARLASNLLENYPRANDTVACWSSIYTLHCTMTHSGHALTARALLENFLPHLPPRWKPTDRNAATLQILWTHVAAAKPPNLPRSWPQTPPLPHAAALPKPRIFTDPMTAAEAEACVEIVKKAYNPERQDPLREFLDLDWRELLQRFSEAAFTVHRKQYRQLENPPRTAGEILLPPISPAGLAEVEERLGPLPADLRAMAAVANGFRGLYRVFGGGLPRLESFRAESCGQSWILFAEDGHFRGRGNEPGEEAIEAPIWVAYDGTEESDGYYHYICPAETWRRLVGDDHWTAGEYRVMFKAHWSGSRAFSSMREWIATETMWMERMMAKGSWEGMEDSVEEDNGNEGLE